MTRTTLLVALVVLSWAIAVCGQSIDPHYYCEAPTITIDVSKSAPALLASIAEDIRGLRSEVASLRAEVASLCVPHFFGPAPICESIPCKGLKP